MANYDDDQTIESKIPDNSEKHEDGKELKTLQKLVTQAKEQREDAISDAEKIYEEYDEQFYVGDPIGQRHLVGDLLFIILERLARDMRLLDFKIHAPDATPAQKKILEETIRYGQVKSGLKDAFLTKFGAGKRKLLVGDAFLCSGVDKNVKQGIKTRFMNVSLDDVWIDPMATELANEGDVGTAQWYAVKFRYSWDKAKEIFPQIEDEAQCGDFPIYEENDEKERLDYTDEQRNDTENAEEREIEIMHFWYKPLKKYYIFAGRNGKLIYESDKDELGLYHFMCFPSQQGFYNHGIGHKFMPHARVMRRLRNQAISATYDNLSPTGVYYIEDAQKANIQAQIAQAMIDRANGGKGIITLDKTRGEAIEVQQLTVPPFSEEFERVLADIERTIKRLGINLDDISINPGETLGQTQIAETNSDEFKQHIMDVDAYEQQRANKRILDDIRDFTSKDDKTIIPTSFSIAKDEEIIEVNGTPITAVQKLLKNIDYDVEIITRTGVEPNLEIKQNRNQQAVQYLSETLPDSDAYKRAMKEFLRLRGLEVTDSELRSQMAEQAQMQQLPQPK
jgi:hypothetical protein